jgi:hypothetical protein
MHSILSSQTRPAWFVLATLAGASAAFAQVDLYSNGNTDPSNPGLATGTLTASGAQAPAGSQWSELQSSGGAANAVAGFSTHALDAGSAYRFADDIVVGGSGWSVSSVSFYAYRADAPAGQSPVSEVNLRVWSGPPGQPGSVIIFGDDQANRLAGSASALVYRVFSTAAAPFTSPTTNRQVWRIDADTSGLRLPAGTYWLDWQFVSSLAGDPVFAPCVTVAGARTSAGWNAMQLKEAAGGTVWIGAMDLGKPAAAADTAQDLPFILHGFCLGDFNADGQIDFFDYLDFVSAYGNEDPAADFNGDAQIDFFDYLDFVNAFDGGC